LSGVIVTGVVELVVREGVYQTAERLGTSWVGNKLARWTVQYHDYLEAEGVIRHLLLEVGPKTTPKVRQNVMVAMKFFREGIPGLIGGAPAQWASYLEGIDFHFDVRHQILAAGSEVVRHGSPGGGTGAYCSA